MIDGLDEGISRAVTQGPQLLRVIGFLRGKIWGKKAPYQQLTEEQRRANSLDASGRPRPTAKVYARDLEAR